MWTAQMKHLANYLWFIHTHLAMVCIWMASLQAWHNGEPFPKVLGVMEAVFHNQTALGWNQRFQGILAEHWVSLLQDYFCLLGNCNAGKCWAIAVIKKHLDIAWGMWEHCNGILHK